MERTLSPSPRPSGSRIVAAAALLASASENAGLVVGVSASSSSTTTTTYTAELYRDLDPAGVENYAGYDFLGLGTTPSGFVPALDRLFFAASHSSSGTELWSLSSSDVEVDNAAIVKDINSNVIDGEVGSALRNFGATTTAVVEGKFFFFADDGENGMELWRTDGTEENTTMVKDINYGTYSGIDENLFASSGIPQIVAFEERVYFPARYNFDRSVGLYVSDGTEEGTQLVEEGINSPLPPSAVVSYITEYNGKTYFPADGEVCYTSNGVVAWCQAGKALFVLEDGLPARQAVNLTAPLITGNSEKTMFVHEGALYFSTTTGLVRTDGTQEGTVSLPIDGGSQYTSMGDAIYFVRSDSAADMYSIQKTDGTAEGTSIVANVTSSVGLSKGLTPLGNKILFHNRNAEYGITQPHVLDILSGNVSILADIETNDIFSYFVVYDGHAFFKAKQNIEVSGTGLELWVTDGTPEGTILVKDIHPGTLGSDIQGYGIFQNNLYFNAQNIETGNELWRVVKCPDGACPAPATEAPTIPLTPSITATPAVSPTPKQTDPTPVTIAQSTINAATVSPDPTRSPVGEANAAEPYDAANYPTFSPTGVPSFSPTYSPVSVPASALDGSGSVSIIPKLHSIVQVALINLLVGVVISF